MSTEEIMTAKVERELESGLVSEILGVDGKQKLNPIADAVLRALDNAVTRKMAGLEAPLVDALTGLVLDSRPDLVGERTGLEELDVQEIRRHRYDGQYPGEPSTHFLGGSNEITFGDCNGRLSKGYDRVKKHAMPVKAQKHQRNVYHQIGFIADRLDLPEPVKEDICRAYTDLKKKEISEAYSLERLLGLLTYLACRIHDFPRGFDDVQVAIEELYDFEIEKRNISREMVRAFNRGPIRFSVENSNGRQYLRTWKRISGKRVNHRSLGSL